MNSYPQTQPSALYWNTPGAARAYSPYQEVPVSIAKAQETEILADAERQMAKFEEEHEATLRMVATQYVMPEDSSVQRFLRSHRTLPQLLIEAIPHLKRCFGELAVFSLRAPVDESGGQMLYGLVVWPGDVNQVRRSLAQFDEDWWIKHSRQASGRLSFSFELV